MAAFVRGALERDSELAARCGAARPRSGASAAAAPAPAIAGGAGTVLGGVMAATAAAVAAPTPRGPPPARSVYTNPLAAVDIRLDLFEATRGPGTPTGLLLQQMPPLAVCGPYRDGGPFQGQRAEVEVCLLPSKRRPRVKVPACVVRLWRTGANGEEVSARPFVVHFLDLAATAFASAHDHGTTNTLNALYKWEDEEGAHASTAAVPGGADVASCSLGLAFIAYHRLK
jgi:hypothetical protein